MRIEIIHQVQHLFWKETPKAKQMLLVVFQLHLTVNTLFFQSALCRQSAVVTKSPNQGQSGTRQGQIGTRVGQIGTGEGQIGTGEGQLEIADRVLEAWVSRKNEISI